LPSYRTTRKLKKPPDNHIGFPYRQSLLFASSDDKLNTYVNGEFLSRIGVFQVLFIDLPKQIERFFFKNKKMGGSLELQLTIFEIGVNGVLYELYKNTSFNMLSSVI
jgi:hypothetical protein